jgi:hypothetical protein
MKLLILASVVTMSACADSYSQSDPMPLLGARWKPDSGGITFPPRTPDGGAWTTYNDLAFINAGVEHVRVNQHDKRVTITRDGADAGWKCRIEEKVFP